MIFLHYTFYLFHSFFLLPLLFVPSPSFFQSSPSLPQVFGRLWDSLVYLDSDQEHKVQTETSKENLKAVLLLLLLLFCLCCLLLILLAVLCCTCKRRREIRIRSRSRGVSRKESSREKLLEPR